MAEELERLRDELESLIEKEPGQLSALAHRVEQLIAASGDAGRVLGIVGSRARSRLASARFAAELLGEPGKLAARASALEDVAVLEWALRPAIPLTGLRAANADGIWPALADLDLSAVAERVCRIDLGLGRDRRAQIGSGVIVSGDGEQWTIATAAHVVADLRAAGWSHGEGVEGWAVVGADPSEDGEAVSLQESYWLHPSQDLALLRAESAGALAELAWDTRLAPGQAIAVVGYPFFDSRRDLWARDFGFREPAGVLRVSPGVALTVERRLWRGATVPLLTHDASTLSGSSGSGLFELPGMRLAGIHVGGWPLAGAGPSKPFSSNGAVPIGELEEGLAWSM